MLLCSPSDYSYAVAISCATKSEFADIIKAAAEELQAISAFRPSFAGRRSVFFHQWEDTTPVSELKRIFCRDSVIVVVMDCEAYFTREGCVTVMMHVREHIERFGKDRFLVFRFNNSGADGQSSAEVGDRIDWLRALGIAENVISVSRRSSQARDSIVSKIVETYELVTSSWRPLPPPNAIFFGNVPQEVQNILREKLAGNFFSETDMEHISDRREFEEKREHLRIELVIVGDSENFDNGSFQRFARSGVFARGSSQFNPWPVRVLYCNKSEWRVRHEQEGLVDEFRVNLDSKDPKNTPLAYYDDTSRVGIVAVRQRRKFSESVTAFHDSLKEEWRARQLRSGDFGFVTIRNMECDSKLEQHPTIGYELLVLRRCTDVILCLDSYFADEFGYGHKDEFLAEYLHVLQKSIQTYNTHQTEISWVLLPDMTRQNDMRLFAQVIQTLSQDGEMKPARGLGLAETTEKAARLGREAASFIFD